MSETTDRSPLRELVIRLCILATGFGGGLAIDANDPLPSLALIWCCDGTDDGCVNVESFGDCPEGHQLFYCELGQSTPSSGSNGESGWECLEQ